MWCVKGIASNNASIVRSSPLSTCSWCILLLQVWLADWAGTQVAVKELMCLQDTAKDRANKKKSPRRSGSGAGSMGSQGSLLEDEMESDTDSVDSVEEEVMQELKTLMDEVYLLGTMSHPNIMRFCAVCLDPPMIVTQYYPHGSMFDLLKKGRRGEKRALMVRLRGGLVVRGNFEASIFWHGVGAGYFLLYDYLCWLCMQCCAHFACNCCMPQVAHCFALQRIMPIDVLTVGDTGKVHSGMISSGRALTHESFGSYSSTSV